MLGQRFSMFRFRRVILIGLARAMADLLLGVIQIQPRLGIGKDYLLQTPNPFRPVANKFDLLCAIQSATKRFLGH